ncbi:hypothetical protein [Streptomyces sp. SP18CS02]|uniref:hypothetical protein n=1 Tax=Streptomyces sp. SP18CS02 TaxID=3002531 RepID=UPI002E774012|nr:hypothetical protein [Streptomyces sp. SP18CS02]MEE1751345.1 hypothetical protein [Streptomyces sp. SP18CS02]
MAAQVTVPARHGRPSDRPHGHGRTALVWSAALGIFYGFYAQFLQRSGEGPVTGGQVVLGVVSAVVFGALCYGLARVRGSLPREVRAGAFGALAGISVGFLHSLTGASILTAVVLGLILAGAVSLGMFYAFYTHE